MNLLLSIVLLLIFIAIMILFFSHIFFHLILDDKKKKGDLRWLFGSLYLDFTVKKMGFDLFNRKIWRGSFKKKEKPPKKKERRKKPNYIILWQEKDTMVKTAKTFFSSMSNLLKRSKLERFLLDFKIGTPDPALTGVLYGGLSSLSFPLQSLLRNSSIYIYPDFETESFKTKVEISLKTRLFDAFWVIVKAFFLLPKIAIIKVIRKLYKKRR